MSTNAAPIDVTALPEPLKTHPIPNLSKLGLTSSYAAPRRSIPTEIPIESNLLILFHGLGDSHLPFFQLGQSLNLPQTCVLAIRAPERIPLLEEEAWQWWQSFDEIGEMILRPNPTKTLTILSRAIDYLIQDCSWRASQLHFFGNSQGGSLAGELALSKLPSLSFASIITIQGPLLSFPTLLNKSPTKVLVVQRKHEESLAGLKEWKKGFENVESVVLPRYGEGGPMPKGQTEWYPIVKFWSQVLERKDPLEFEKDVYRVG